MSNPARPINPLLDKAIVATQRGDHAAAERFAGAVLKAERANTLAGRVLGTALLAQGRAAEAVGPLQHAARRAADPAIETLLARALAATGRRDDAHAQWRSAMARRPAFPLAFLELGNDLGAAGRIPEGIEVFEQGLALTPGIAELRLGLGYLHFQRNDRPAARAAFQAVLAAEPGRADALAALARLLVVEGDYAAAADLYRRALAVQPQDGMLRISLAKCQLELGARGAGEASLRAAVRAAGALAPHATLALADAAHGRFFLRPSRAARFLRSG